MQQFRSRLATLPRYTRQSVVSSYPSLLCASTLNPLPIQTCNRSPLGAVRQYEIDMAAISRGRRKPGDKNPTVDIDEGLLLMRSYLTSHDKSYDPDLEVRVYVNNFHAKKNVNIPVRGTMTLPHSTGTAFKVLVLSNDPDVLALASKNGADEVGNETKLDEILKGSFTKYDFIISTSDLETKLKKSARVLKEKTPTYRRGTLVDKDEVVNAIKSCTNTLKFEGDDGGIIYSSISKVRANDMMINDNIRAFMQNLIEQKPESLSGVKKYVKSAYIRAKNLPHFKLSEEQIKKLSAGEESNGY